MWITIVVNGEVGIVDNTYIGAASQMIYDVNHSVYLHWLYWLKPISFAGCLSTNKL